MNDEQLNGTNGDELTLPEVHAIMALARLAKKWPRTLTLLSMGGTLCVMHTGDERFGAYLSSERSDVVLYVFDGIPNDGGDW